MTADDGLVRVKVPDEVLKKLNPRIIGRVAGLPEFLEDGHHRFKWSLEVTHPDDCECPWAPRAPNV